MMNNLESTRCRNTCLSMCVRSAVRQITWLIFLLLMRLIANNSQMVSKNSGYETNKDARIETWTIYFPDYSAVDVAMCYVI